ncbi:thioesterase family protein [Pelagibaculum spongiae]|uniref:Thioesterase n=1 Tax=Pelagibaculum spongiae TaxID=2080658 RepID=A0A2V1GS97_9GAMM|nr:thioesterase family protein [Pelagibaculum spongiae]PVZ68269.1 thioesterase [Pelagibaculum spongiae]
MNLYLRLLLLIARIRTIKQFITLEQASHMHFRVWPHDCDINLHLTNSRYLGMMDLGRTWMLAEMGQLSSVVKRGWKVIMNAQEISYIRELSPFQKFTLETRMVGWDEKYFYVEQRFVSGGKLYAIAHVRGLFIHKRKAVAMGEVLDHLEQSQGSQSPRINQPPQIIAWKQLLEQKKQASLQQA